MSTLSYQVRPGAYYDSIILMQLQRALADLPGVEDAGVVMASAANCRLLDASGLLPEDVEAGTEDLLVVVRAINEEKAQIALEQVDALLERRRSDVSQSFRPRGLDSAAQLLPDAKWVLVSVPGRYAADVARAALDLKKHVFLYSDNVSLADEVELKRTAQERGLLLLGPDCGTSIIGGVGLGFANHVRRGRVGLVAASGTGLQAVSSHLHQFGGGISQAIGTGGRDLSPEVGGMTTIQALDLLSRDEGTDRIVLVSKPPAPEVVAPILAAAHRIDKPVIIYFIGEPVTLRRLDNLVFALNLHDAAELAVGGLPAQDGEHEIRTNRRKDAPFVRGLFAGGTIAYEMVLGLQSYLSPMYSNAPVRSSQRLADPNRSVAHSLLDLGADEFTQGRLHPMMDNDLRIRRLRREAAAADVGLILLDVVLGEGAHPDPAAELAPVIADVHQHGGPAVAVLLLGTDADPQGYEEQAAALEEAGADIFSATDAMIAAVARWADRRGDPGKTFIQVRDEALREPFAAINVGLETFYDSLEDQGAQALQVDWRPPARGNEEMMALLARLRG